MCILSKTIYEVVNNRSNYRYSCEELLEAKYSL